MCVEIHSTSVTINLVPSHAYRSLQEYCDQILIFFLLLIHTTLCYVLRIFMYINTYVRIYSTYVAVSDNST